MRKKDFLKDLLKFFSKLLRNRKTTPPKTKQKRGTPQHNSGLFWNRPWSQNCSPNIVFVRHFLKYKRTLYLEKKIPKFNIMSFCEYFIKILIKHPSKYKILRSKSVEEVSRTDERVDMGKWISRSTFRCGAL